jgi:hypothetical protein
MRVSDRWGAEVVLGVVLASWLPLTACTKVVEQPAAPPPPTRAAPAPKAAKAPAPRPAPAPWPSEAPARKAAPTAAPAAAEKPALPADTLNGDPRGLRRDDLGRALDGALGSLASCFPPGSASGGVSLSFDADPSGRARNVKVAGGGAAAESCVSEKVAALRLPAFEGKAVPVQFPLSIHSAPAAQPGAAKPAEATPPPTFIKP